MRKNFKCDLPSSSEFMRAQVTSSEAMWLSERRVYANAPSRSIKARERMGSLPETGLYALPLSLLRACARESPRRAATRTEKLYRSRLNTYVNAPISVSSLAPEPTARPGLSWKRPVWSTPGIRIFVTADLIGHDCFGLNRFELPLHNQLAW